MRQGFCTLILGIFLGGVGVQKADAIPHGKEAPAISGSSWINSAPLKINDLKGRVILVEFWTYG